MKICTSPPTKSMVCVCVMLPTTTGPWENYGLCSALEIFIVQKKIQFTNLDILINLDIQYTVLPIIIILYTT